MTIRYVSFALALVLCNVTFASDWNSLLKRNIDATNTRFKLSRENMAEADYYTELAKLRDESAAITEELVTLAKEAETSESIRFMAIELILTNRFAGKASFDAADLLLESKLNSDQLSQICFLMAFGWAGASPASELSLHKIIENTDNDELKYLAKLCLARIVRRKIEDAAAIQRLSNRRYHAIRELGPEYVAEMLKLDIDSLHAETLNLLENIQGDVGEKILFGDLSRNEFALQELQAWQRQTIRCEALAIAGTDTAGLDFELADYAGRVRVLLFWGHWCGPCRKAYPLYRSLGSEYPEGSFAFLGINSDKKLETITDAMENGDVDWRCWWDGDRAIHEKWSLFGAPHIYVLDTNGKIAFVDVRGEELKEAVAVLIAQKEGQ